MTSRQDIENELRVKIGTDAEVGRDAQLFAYEVLNRWIEIWEMMGPHPYETGDYTASLEVRSTGAGRARHPKGARSASGEAIGGRFIEGGVVWSYWVGTDDEVAAFIEYGTGPDLNGVGVWQDLDGSWHKSPNTPTPEFAPAAHVAAFYGGTSD